MAASMNVEQLINSLLGGEMWHISDAVDIINTEPFAATMAGIRIAASLMAFGVLCLQAFKIFIDGFQGQEALRRSITALFIAAIIMIFIESPMYTLFMKTVIAGPPQTIAGMIRDAYNKDFMEVAANAWKAVGASKSDGGIFALNIATQLVSTIISVIVYLISTVLMILMPVIQKMLFKLMVIIGPLCMVFALSDYTKSIAKQWLGLTLAIAWLGVFGAVAQYLSLTVQTSMINEVQNPLTTIIYGLVSIILQISAFSISAFLFGAVGSGMDRMANPVTAGATVTSTAASGIGSVGAAGIATGAFASGAGTLMNSVGNLANRIAPQSGGLGDMMRGIGSGMQTAGVKVTSAGNFVSGKSDAIMQLSKAMTGRSAPKTIGPKVQGKSDAVTMQKDIDIGLKGKGKSNTGKGEAS